MKEKKNTKTAVKKGDVELLLSVFLVIFIVLAIVLTVALVITTVAPPAGGGEQETETEDPNGPSAPVFAGNAVAIIPSRTDASKAASSLKSDYGILVNAQTGEILAYKNASDRFSPASLTKVMTLIVACENLKNEDLDKEILMTEDLWEYVNSGEYVGTSKVYFDVNDKVRVEDLLYGIGVKSASDSAMMVAMALYPESSPKRAEGKLVELMNEKAAQMGLADTHFDNIIGYESEDNYSTVSDMAAIMIYALESPLIRDILSVSKPYVFYRQALSGEDGAYESEKITMQSTLFTDRYKKYKEKTGDEFSLDNAELLGGKTGTLDKSSLVSFAEAEDGQLYVCVTGDASQAYLVLVDAKTLYEDYIPS